VVHPARAKSPPAASGASDGGASLVERIRSELFRRIGERRAGIWFDAQTTRLKLEGGSLAVELANPYVAEWVEKHFAGTLRALAHDVLGADATVALTLAPAAFGRADDDQPQDHDRRPAQVAGRDDDDGDVDARRAPARPEGRPLPPPPVVRRPSESRRPALRSLDEFVSGPSNQLAFDAARRLAEAAPGSPNLLFVHGDCGVGKTHLLQGICDRRRAVLPRQNIRYTTAEQFTNEYLLALREGSLEQFRKALRRLDLLAIDDIHFLSNKTATQSEFLHTMNAIDLGGAKIVLASDEHPRHIRKFSQALVSRFLSGMVVRVDRPDRQTRVALVRKLAADRGIVLQPGAEELVANRCVGSVREIEGALARLSAFASLADEAADRPAEAPRESGPSGIGTLIAERAFEEESLGRPSGPIRLADIVGQVATRLGVDRDDVLGTSRHRRVVLARSLVVHLAREMTTQSFPEIARGLGRDTHSTAHTAAKRVEQMLADGERVETGDPSLAGPDGRTPLKELLAQLRHDIARGAGRGR
jgi:chromosomal replication initiator protein